MYMDIFECGVDEADSHRGANIEPIDSKKEKKIKNHKKVEKVA